MDPFMLILIGAVAVYFLFFKKKAKQKAQTGADTSKMTETQRNWHNYRLTEKAAASNSVSDEATRIIEANQFIKDNMRSFTIMGWLFDPIHASIAIRLLPMYIIIHGIPIVVFLFGTAIFGAPVSLIYFVPLALFSDYIYYRQSRMNEVIYDNPEFCEKYGDLVLPTK